MGTHAHVPPELEEEVCCALGLGVAPASTQIVQRDRHAFMLAVLAGIGGTLEKLRSRSAICSGPKLERWKSRSTRGTRDRPPCHKRNPHASERITGLARLLRGYATTAAENNALA